MIHPSEVEEVLDQIAAGHRDAFQVLVRAYGLSLRSFIGSQLHHMDDVDDMAQDVLTTAFCHLHSFRRGDDFGAWLRGIARHKLADHFRNAARRNKALERFREEVARTVQAEIEREASQHSPLAIETLLRCISRLPEKLRRVVRGGLEGDKPASLARELMTTVGAVYNLHYRANQLLRECVKKELD